MKVIENRDDVESLVNAFYIKIRKDELLGPIFNGQIPAEKWPEHLRNLSDFWETNLFGIRKFKGNPMEKHIGVDQDLNYKIDQGDFGQWLNLWFQTIDELFEGELAQKAKNAARKMSTVLYTSIWRARPENLTV